MSNAFSRILNVAGGLAPRGGPAPINLPGYPAVSLHTSSSRRAAIHAPGEWRLRSHLYM